MKDSIALSGAPYTARVAAQPQTRPIVTTWLYTMAVLVALMVVVGGYVRLSRSGLSIVEWNAITGVVPPLTAQAWQEEFAKYQQSPEYQKVNAGMSLDEYKSIFYVEYVHRLIARLVGLVLALPLAYFLLRGFIPWRQSGVYIGIGALFLFQAFMGWFMVASGLVDRPSVSHYRLTAHLLTALALLALCLWTALNHTYRITPAQPGVRVRLASLGLVLTAVVLLQITYGGLTAGLKAGHVSNTWPLMFGYLVPPGLLALIEPWWRNLVDSLATVQFIHRWLAFVVLTLAYVVYRRAAGDDSLHSARTGAATLVAIVSVQILLGISVVLFDVMLPLALLHQATAITLFAAAIFLNHRLIHATA